ncbi:MAG: hypothetical protein ACFE96_15850 [Candidatus Hermodarchaeota archaeon]
MDSKKIWESLKRNKKKIWNVTRWVYWSLIFVVSLISIYLLLTEFLL